MSTLRVHTVGGTVYEISTDKNKEKALSDAIGELHNDGYLLYDAGEETTVYIPLHAVVAVHASPEDEEDDRTHHRDNYRYTACGLDTSSVLSSWTRPQVDCPECLKIMEDA